MTEEKLRFVNDIIKPWEILNHQLSFPFSVNTSISDFTNKAMSLAISLKHFPESAHGIDLKTLIDDKPSPYQIISDLADSLKHGQLRDPKRQSNISAGSMFERSNDGLVRFLRNTINIQHNQFGGFDFLEVALESAKFVAGIVDFRSNWSPKIACRDGDFSDKIRVHASHQNQIAWQGMAMQFVEKISEGRYKPVELNSKILFHLTVDSELRP